MLSRVLGLFHNNIARNTFALFVLQLVNMIAPLLVLPFLTRVLGVDGFGTAMLSLAVCSVGLILTDFGFNLSATYKVSKDRENKEQIAEFIGAVFLIKVALVSIFSICIYFYSALSQSELASPTLLLFICMSVAFQAFMPTWFYLGIERMKNITLFMVFAKLIYLILNFAFVRDEGDVSLVVLFYAISNFVATTIGIYCIYSNGYKIKLPIITRVASVLKDSYQFFISRAAVSIYTALNMLVVGAFAGAQQVAMYSVSEKLYQASQSITSPVAQAIFPYLAKSKDQSVLSRTIIFVGAPLALGCLLVGYWAEDLLTLLFGAEFAEAKLVLQLFLTVTIVNFICVMFGYPAFGTLDKIHLANYTVYVGAAVQLIILYFLYLTNGISAISVVASVLITETVVMLLRMTLYIRHKA